MGNDVSDLNVLSRAPNVINVCLLYSFSLNSISLTKNTLSFFTHILSLYNLHFQFSILLRKISPFQKSLEP